MNNVKMPFCMTEQWLKQVRLAEKGEWRYNKIFDDEQCNDCKTYLEPTNNQISRIKLRRESVKHD